MGNLLKQIEKHLTIRPVTPSPILLFLPENSGRAGWAELAGQIEQGYFAATLDFYSVWYRDHLVMKIAKSEQLHFGMTGPSLGRNLHNTFFIFHTIKLWKNT